jgi:hypothetical protein
MMRLLLFVKVLGGLGLACVCDCSWCDGGVIEEHQRWYRLCNCEHELAWSCLCSSLKVRSACDESGLPSDCSMCRCSAAVRG